ATPAVVVAGLLIAATVILGRGADTGARVAVAAASVLSIAFLFSPQAFANYWLVVAVLILISLIPEADDPVPIPSGDSGHRRQRETGAG
ncbi:MAG TPA: hypothetical protein VLB67_13985, partial [Acidimicrobiia bacterium]|nr:hypothetical protein [Acidimicrobiia bacterium]